MEGKKGREVSFYELHKRKEEEEEEDVKEKKKRGGKEGSEGLIFRGRFRDGGGVTEKKKTPCLLALGR